MGAQPKAVELETERLIAWFRSRAGANKGHIPSFTNADAITELRSGGVKDNARAHGNVQSRVDFACYKCGLPPLGLTAVAGFRNAWAQQHRRWRFPREEMQAAAQSHRWTKAEFDQIQEACASVPLSPPDAWIPELAKKHDPVRAWAECLKVGTRAHTVTHPERTLRLSREPKSIAIYAISDQRYLTRCLRSGRVGVLENAASWKDAAEYLQIALATRLSLPLLLANENSAVGVEWVALIDGIERVAGRRSIVHFSQLQKLTSPIPLHDLVRISDSVPLSEHLKLTSAPCLFPRLPHGTVLKRVAPEPADDTLAIGAKVAIAEIDADPQCRGLATTTKKALVEARIGQGRFRTAMLRVWGGRCALTGCEIREVLIASHAKSWATSSNDERLDAFNGLLLAASIDRLFDKGLIAFSDTGEVLVGEGLSPARLKRLGISASSKLRSVHPRNIRYLAEHRRRFGFEG